jgi:hypothetical protein
MASGGGDGVGAAGAVGVARGTIFGASDLPTLVAQLNAWAPQVETSVQQVMGAAMVAEGRIQQLAEGGAAELTNIVTAFRTELDVRTASRAVADEALKEELRVLMNQVHLKFVEIEGAMNTMRTASAQAAPAAAAVPTATPPAPTVAPPSGAASTPSAMSPDPWAAAAAAAAAARQGAGLPHNPVPPAGPSTTPSMNPPGLDKRYRVDNKNWGGHRCLDLDANPEGFIAWRERALGHLSTARPDIRKLLLWAEQHAGEITEVAEARAAVEVNLMEDVGYVSFVLFEAIKAIMADGLLSRARACGDGRGLELWRRLHTEWRGNAPQVVAAKARKYLDPQRCANMQKLWEAMPLWEQLGSEVALGGYPVPDWVRSQALDKLVPQDMMTTIVGKPELAEFKAKVSWVKTQMEHARGVSQASYVHAAGARGGGGAKDMEVGELAQEETASVAPSSSGSLLWSLQSELGRCSVEGDWDAVGALTGAIYALSKGKGKGKSGGKGGKGVKGGYGGKGGYQGDYGKGSYHDSKGGGKGTFDGICHHCNAYGHRKSQCRKLDQELAARGKGGGKKGGGKSLNYAGAEENWFEEGVNEQTATTQDKGQETQPESEWWVGATFSLRREDSILHGAGTADQVVTGSLPSGSEDFQPPRKPLATRSFRSDLEGPKPPRISNSFSILERDEPCQEGYCLEHGWPTLSATAETRAEKRKRMVGGRVQFKEDFDKEIKDHDRLMQLLTKDDKLVGAVARDDAAVSGAFKVIEAVIDSGAEESVAPPGLFPGAVEPSKMSRAGGRYRAANGARIPNLGQVKVRFENDAGDKCGTTFQVAEVERPLISATQLAASGNAVIIDQKGARIVNQRTKKTMGLIKRGGVYVLRMKVRANPAPGFPGPGK